MANSGKTGLFSPIHTREDALKTVRDASIGFLFLAGLQAAVGLAIAPALLLDALILGSLGLWLMKSNSRLAAVLLLIVAVLEAMVTVLNKLKVTHSGGTNIFLGILMVIVAVRAVEATFKLNNTTFAPRSGGAAGGTRRVVTGR
jgi:K+ transporter